MFKGIYDKNPDAMNNFFQAIGYKSTSATKYEFQRPAALEEGQEAPEGVNQFAGNIEVLETVAKIIEAETQKLSTA